MKTIALLFLTVFMFSCGNNKEEQMLYDYQQKDAKIMNFDLKDLNFKIQKVEKVSDITASDSLKHLKQKLAKVWSDNPDKSLVDTLSFKYVKDFLNERITYQDTLAKLHQAGLLVALKVDDYSYELESKRGRDKAIDKKYSFMETLLNVEQLEQYYDKLSVKPDSILSSKYNAIYSANNPMLNNTKQTFEKVYYTNAGQTKFVIVENADNENK